MKENQRCHNCLYSREYEVIDRIGDTYLEAYIEKFNIKLPEKSTITKCHLHGAPQRVHPEVDWCYQWTSSK